MNVLRESGSRAAWEGYWTVGCVVCMLVRILLFIVETVAFDV
jgi:hypothetical protein